MTRAAQRILWAAYVLDQIRTWDEPPTGAELSDFEERCRRAHPLELGDLLYRAPTKAHAEIASRVLVERLQEMGE